MNNQLKVAETTTSLIVRSEILPKENYLEYKEDLQYDFFHSCAYCTMSESEAAAVRFCIDHYDPQEAQPDLVNVYNNLMYCCDSCNARKGDRYPPLEARKNGYRFFRPDEDLREEHFTREGDTLSPLSITGD